MNGKEKRGKHSIKDILNVIIKSNEHQMKFDTLNSMKISNGFYYQHNEFVMSAPHVCECFIAQNPFPPSAKTSGKITSMRDEISFRRFSAAERK